MRVIVTANNPNLDDALDTRFGRAQCFILFDTDTGDHEVIENTQNLNAAQGAGIQAARNVVNANAQAIVTGNVGPKAFATLTAGNVAIYLCQDACSVKDALKKYQNGELQPVTQANVEGHWI